MENYDEIRELLTPRRDIKASDELRRKVRSTLRSHDRKQTLRRNWFWSGIGISAAVAAVMLLVLIPSGMSAREVLTEAMNMLDNTDNLEMTVEVRTRPAENFRYIDIDNDFVTHKLNVSVTDSLMTWRIDKGDRIAVGRNGDVNVWIPYLKLGWHLKKTDTGDFLGYFASLLNPRKILESELSHCVSEKGADYSVRKHGTDIILTVHSMPQGDFENPYLLNTSIVESENIRRYVIDSLTKRLKSASVSVISGNRETVVLNITSITYNSKNISDYPLPADIHFVDNENELTALKGLSAEEAASTILNAFADWDNSILDKVMHPSVSQAAYKDRFIGSELLSVGAAFNSGNNNSIFVPYCIRLKDGTLQRHNLALQKNNAGGWIVAGGL